MKMTITIKGIGESLQVSALENDWRKAYPSLLEVLNQQADFFHGARIALNVDTIDLTTEDLRTLLDELLNRDIYLRAIYSSSEITLASASELGIALSLPSDEADHIDEPSLDPELPSEDAIFLQRTLRSGQSIHYPGHVIVLGDVNPGSEIIAGGNVIVWGRLRGTVHAGATGNEDAIVCALDLNPTQLRIGGHIAISPDHKRRAIPEVVRIHDGQLVAEDWQKSRRK
jgi:septum site-determining protein MinC